MRIDPAVFPPAVESAASQRLLLQAWQWQAFNYYNTIGEIWFGGQFYARGLQNLRLFVGRKDENNEIEEVEDNPQAQAILDDVQDPGGGRASMLGSYGQLMWLIGEGYMLVTPPSEDAAARNTWEFVSPSELRVQSGVLGMLRQTAPGLSQTALRYVDAGDWTPTQTGTGIAYRYWRRHPQFSAQADAPMRGVLLLCDELERLTAAVRARAVSRLAGPGLLLIPDEISQPPPEPVGDEDPQVDIFMRDFTDATITPISDPGTASAQVPMIVRGAAEFLKEIRHVQIHDPMQTYPEEGLRTECIRRIALGLDMPPEVLLGTADVNHWNAWQIDEQTWKSHLQPVAQRFCEDLTASYFREACREEDVNGWEDLVIWYDAAAIINHPDRTKDAKDLYDRGALSLETLREVAGFDDDDAPTEQDRAERIGVATHDSSLAWFGIPSIRSGGIEPQPGEIESGAGTSSAPGGPPQVTGGEAEKAPPANPVEEPVTASVRVIAWELERLSGAAELTIDRCRELAGSRLRTKITRAGNGDRCNECIDLIRDVPNSLVAASLGDTAGGLSLPSPRELVAGGAEGFRLRASAWGVDTDAAALLADQLEAHAARTLFDIDPVGLPKGFAAKL